MPKLRVHNYAMSADGYVAGPEQSLDNPLGVGGEQLHEWIFATDIGPADQDFVLRGDANVGATIMGRNMYGPIRGEWGAEEWRGWWGDNPPFHHPVFVLTHHRHDPIEMDGGTTFHFVDGRIESVLEQAYAAANGADVRLGGGAATVREYIRAGLVDDLHLAVVPVLLRGGERLFVDLDAALAGYECVEFVSSPSVAHMRFARH